MKLREKLAHILLRQSENSGKQFLALLLRQDVFCQKMEFSDQIVREHRIGRISKRKVGAMVAYASFCL